MKYVICGNYGVGNFGDECIAEGIENLLRKKDSNSEFVRMGKGLLFPFGARSFIKSLYKWNLWKKPLDAIRWCDYFILGGGGLFTDEERPYTGFFWAMQAMMPLLLKKPIIVLGVSMGSMGYISNQFAKFVFKRAKSVYCRDEQSVLIAKKFGAIHAALCPDMAMYSPMDKNIFNSTRDDEKKSIIFVLRDYANFDKNKIKIIVQTAKLVYRKHGLNTIITSFDKSSRNDEVLLRKISDHENSLNIISVHEPIHNISDLSRLYSESRLVICMRYHAGIFALFSGTPFISINYMKKSSNFWSTIPNVLTVDYNYCDSILLENVMYVLDSSEYANKIRNASKLYIESAQKFADFFCI